MMYSRTSYLHIAPYADLGPAADYSDKVEAAKNVLGKKWCLYNPRKQRQKQTATVRQLRKK